MAKLLQLRPQALEIAPPRNASEPDRAVVIEHDIEGAIPVSGLVVPREPRTAQLGQPVQSLIVAASDWQLLRRIKEKGIGYQGVDQPVEGSKRRRQIFKGIPAVNENIGRGALAQAPQQCAQGVQLVEGLATRDGDPFRLIEPGLHASEQLHQFQSASARRPGVSGDAAGTANGAALEPDTQPAAGTQCRHREMHARDGDLHDRTSRRSSWVIFPGLIAEMMARLPGVSPLSNRARAKGLPRCTSTLLRMPRPPFDRSARHNLCSSDRAPSLIWIPMSRLATSLSVPVSMASKISLAMASRTKSNTMMFSP